MSHLLVQYEIADKASKVTSRTGLAAFEKWLYETLKQYHDAAIEHVARIYLIRLKEQFS